MWLTFRITETYVHVHVDGEKENRFVYMWGNRDLGRGTGVERKFEKRAYNVERERGKRKGVRMTQNTWKCALN